MKSATVERKKIGHQEDSSGSNNEQKDDLC